MPALIDWLTILDLAALAWIIRQGEIEIKISRENLANTRDFIVARTKWYNARNKPKADDVPPPLPANELVLLAESDDGERAADGLPAADSSQPRTGPGDADYVDEPPEQSQLIGDR